MNSRSRDPGQQGGVSGGSQGTGGIGGGDDHGRKHPPEGEALRGGPRDGTSSGRGGRSAQGTERGYDEAAQGPEAATENPVDPA